MGNEGNKHRKLAALLLGVFVFISLLLVAAQNAFNLKFLKPDTTGQILIFTAISAIVFLLFVVLLVLLLRNILKLYADQQSRVLGARLRTRMLVGALLLSFAPAVFMFSFSFGLMNRSIDRWFSQPATLLRYDSMRVADQLMGYAVANARAEAESIGSAATVAGALEARDQAGLEEVMRDRELTLEGGFAAVLVDDHLLSSYGLGAKSGPDGTHGGALNGAAASAGLPDTETLGRAALKAARQQPDLPWRLGDSEFSLGTASLDNGAVVIVGLPLPSELASTIENIRQDTEQYFTLLRARRQVRLTYLLLLMMMTALTFFASSWLALFLSKQITRPVEALADAMDAIAEGNYGYRVERQGLEEMGELVRSFNHMAGDLEDSRLKLEFSTSQLSTANATLEERRRELETVLETIPSGVVTLDEQLQVVHSNRAFNAMLGLPGGSAAIGAPLADVLPAEVMGELGRLARSSRRMGSASSELALKTNRGELSVALTAAPLGRGFVLVLDNLTELLRAQRQVAWKEVAQRVAHEIKNPLTPIGLSAERIRRHVDRGLAGESAGIIRRCSEVISGSVESLRILVNQFAALAQFPAAQPRPENLNGIVESMLAMFAGRLDGIRLEKRLDPLMPMVMADPEALKRALANMVDNAAEAMHDALHRVLTVETNLLEDQNAAEVVVGDTGHGLTEEMRERLFLPFFSTKKRGTGLGLSIAAKIVQEHGGTLRAESNVPAGARFILELPLAERPAAEALVTGSDMGAAL